MRRIDCAVTLLPQPLSPTMPKVFPGKTSKDAPSTAFVVPSSWKKLVLQVPDRQERLRGIRHRSALQIRIRRVPDAVAHEIEREDRDDDGEGRDQKPGRDDQRLDVLRILEQDAPADRGRPQAQAEEARATSR